MSEKRGSAYFSIFFGLLLVIAGAIWILNELRIIEIPFYLFWIAAAKMWPLILIVVGICIIFRSRIVTFIIAIIYVLIIIAGAYGLSGAIDLPFIEKLNYIKNDFDNKKAYEMQIDKLADTTQAELNLNIGIAEDTVISGADNDYLLDFKTDISPQTDVINTFGKQTVNINCRQRKIDNSYFKLNKDVIWDLSIKSGSSELDLDLRDLNVEDIDIDSGASDIKGRLSSKAAKVNINISSGASDIEFKIPRGSACEIVSSSAATSIKIGDEKISGIGKKTYRSDNFDTALNKFYFNISSGASEISISYY